MIRIGIIGCGRILAAHLRGYRLLREASVDNFRITALCARKEDDALMYVKRGSGPPQRAAVSNTPGDPLAIDDEFLSDFQDVEDVEVFTDYEKMIREGAIDAVNDFTIHSLHHPIAKLSFENGKDLMTQKPLAVTVKAARQMCDLAAENQRVFGVFENARYKPHTRQLKWLFDSGRIGKLQLVLMGNVGTWWAPNRIVAETPWRHQQKEAGGITLDLGVHQFNLIRHLAGEVKDISGRAQTLEPTRITVNSTGETTDEMNCDADDTFFASFESETGVTGNLFASWAGHGEPTVVGPGAVFYAEGGRVAGNQVTFDDGSTANLDELYAEHCNDERKQREFPLGLNDQFALTQFDWLQAIENRTQPETDGIEGLKDLACAFSVLESSTASRTINVADVLQEAVAEFQAPLNLHFGLS